MKSLSVPIHSQDILFFKVWKYMALKMPKKVQLRHSHAFFYASKSEINALFCHGKMKFILISVFAAISMKMKKCIKLTLFLLKFILVNASLGCCWLLGWESIKQALLQL